MSKEVLRLWFHVCFWMGLLVMVWAHKSETSHKHPAGDHSAHRHNPDEILTSPHGINLWFQDSPNVMTVVKQEMPCTIRPLLLSFKCLPVLPVEGVVLLEWQWRVMRQYDDTGSALSSWFQVKNPTKTGFEVLLLPNQAHVGLRSGSEADNRVDAAAGTTSASPTSASPTERVLNLELQGQALLKNTVFGGPPLKQDFSLHLKLSMTQQHYHLLNHSVAAHQPTQNNQTSPTHKHNSTVVADQQEDEEEEEAPEPVISTATTASVRFQLFQDRILRASVPQEMGPTPLPLPRTNVPLTKLPLLTPEKKAREESEQNFSWLAILCLLAAVLGTVYGGGKTIVRLRSLAKRKYVSVADMASISSSSLSSDPYPRLGTNQWYKATSSLFGTPSPLFSGDKLV